MTSGANQGGCLSPPYGFTVQGAAVLCFGLGSARTIAVTIETMRSFLRVSSR